MGFYDVCLFPWPKQPTVIVYWDGGGAETSFPGSKPSPLTSAGEQKIWPAWRFPNPSMNLHREQTNHKINDESEMRTRKKRTAITWKNN